MSALAPIAPRLGQLVRMLGSPSDGEIVAAVHAIGRTLKSVGEDWHTLADRIETEPVPVAICRDRAPRSPKPSRRSGTASGWTGTRSQAVVKALKRALDADILNEFETEFAESVLASIRSSAGWRPSSKQISIIDRIVDRAQRGGVA